MHRGLSQEDITLNLISVFNEALCFLDVYNYVSVIQNVLKSGVARIHFEPNTSMRQNGMEKALECMGF